MICLQSGQVWLALSHRLIHFSWKVCPQDSFLRVSASSYSSMQTQQREGSSFCSVGALKLLLLPGEHDPHFPLSFELVDDVFVEFGWISRFRVLLPEVLLTWSVRFKKSPPSSPLLRKRVRLLNVFCSLDAGADCIGRLSLPGIRMGGVGTEVLPVWLCDWSRIGTCLSSLLLGCSGTWRISEGICSWSWRFVWCWVSMLICCRLSTTLLRAEYPSPESWLSVVWKPLSRRILG